MKAGSIFIDHTHASAMRARELYEEAAKGTTGFLDAPVSGGQSNAEQQTLTKIVGGVENTFAKAEPVLACFAHTSRFLGLTRYRKMAKMVNHKCVVGFIQTLAKGIHCDKNASLDVNVYYICH